jgi:hypothetical protein
MQTKWILRSTSLPGAGDPVDFLLLNRSVPIHGAFTDGVFHARWADYGVDRVESWCVSDDQLAAAPTRSTGFSIRAIFNRTLKRWSDPAPGTASAHPG